MAGAEPCLVLNMGTGTLKEGANYLSCVTSHLVDMY